MIDVSKMRLLRKGKKLSQQELGEMICVDQTTISKIEKGEIPITTDRLIDIAQALGVPPSELLISNPPCPQPKRQRGAGVAVTAATT